MTVTPTIETLGDLEMVLPDIPVSVKNILFFFIIIQVWVSAVL